MVIADKKKEKGFFAKILSAGMMLTVWGKMRAGKTNFAVRLIERAIERGFHVYTNIPFFKHNQITEAIKQGFLLDLEELYGIVYKHVPPEIKTTRTCSELLRGLFSSRKNLTILDEAGLFAASSMGTSKKVRWLKALIFTIGKLDSAIVIIAQDKGSVIPSIRSTLVSYEIHVIKDKHGKRTAELYKMPQELSDDEPEPKFLRNIRNLKATSLPFDSRAPTKFEFDLDIEKFFNEIANYNSLDAINEAPRILDEMLKGNNKMFKQPDKENKRDMILEIIQENESIDNKEILKAMKKKGMPCTMSYLTSVKRELAVSE